MSTSYNLCTLEMIQYEGKTRKISFYSGKISSRNSLQGNELGTVSEFEKYNQKMAY